MKTIILALLLASTAFGSAALTPAQVTTLQNWRATQSIHVQRCSTKMRLVLLRPSVVMVPSAPIARDAYSLEHDFFLIVQADYGPLSIYANKTPKERFVLLRGKIIDARNAASTNMIARLKVIEDAADLKALNDKAVDLGGGLNDPLFHQTTAPQPDSPTPGPSPLDVMGIPKSEINRKVLEAL